MSTDSNDPKIPENANGTSPTLVPPEEGTEGASQDLSPNTELMRIRAQLVEGVDLDTLNQLRIDAGKLVATTQNSKLDTETNAAESLKREIDRLHLATSAQHELNELGMGWAAASMERRGEILEEAEKHLEELRKNAASFSWMQQALEENEKRFQQLRKELEEEAAEPLDDNVHVLMPPDARTLSDKFETHLVGEMGLKLSNPTDEELGQLRSDAVKLLTSREAEEPKDLDAVARAEDYLKRIDAKCALSDAFEVPRQPGEVDQWMHTQASGPATRVHKVPMGRAPTGDDQDSIEPIVPATAGTSDHLSLPEPEPEQSPTGLDAAAANSGSIPTEGDLPSLETVAKVTKTQVEVIDNAHLADSRALPETAGESGPPTIIANEEPAKLAVAGPQEVDAANQTGIRLPKGSNSAIPLPVRRPEDEIGQMPDMGDIDEVIDSQALKAASNGGRPTPPSNPMFTARKEPGEHEGSGGKGLLIGLVMAAVLLLGFFAWLSKDDVPVNKAKDSLTEAVANDDDPEPAQDEPTWADDSGGTPTPEIISGKEAFPSGNFRISGTLVAQGDALDLPTLGDHPPLRVVWEGKDGIKSSYRLCQVGPSGPIMCTKAVAKVPTPEQVAASMRN